VQESTVVFIQNGLACIEKSTIRILEIGFGTGLNALLTYKYASENNKIIHYTGIEKYPISLNLAKTLNYPELCDVSPSIFKKMHQSGEETFSIEEEKFYLKRLNTDLLDADFGDLPFDLIYFDAFAPEKQPELWTSAVFTNLYKILNPGGILCTYSSKGIVKQALRDAGFDVKRKVGPPGKHHVLQCRK